MAVMLTDKHQKKMSRTKVLFYSSIVWFLIFASLEILNGMLWNYWMYQTVYFLVGFIPLIYFMWIYYNVVKYYIHGKKSNETVK